MGGKARASKLSPERRHEIAINAGLVTKAKYGKDYYRNIRNGIKMSDNGVKSIQTQKVEAIS